MKKSIMIAIGAALSALAVSVFVYANNGKNEMDDLFYANVEALARNEGGGNDYAAKIWWRYDRPDGGFNCTRGGNRNCL